MNIKMFMITSQQSREDAREIGVVLGLSDKTVETINSYPIEKVFCRPIGSGKRLEWNNAPI
jgi:hypothetical protein